MLSTGCKKENKGAEMYTGKCDFCGTIYHYDKLPESNQCPSCGALIDFAKVKSQRNTCSLQDKMKKYNQSLKVTTATDIIRPILNETYRGIDDVMWMTVLISGALCAIVGFSLNKNPSTLVAVFIFLLSALVALSLGSVLATALTIRANKKIESRLGNMYEQYESDYQEKRKVFIDSLKPEERHTVEDKKMIADKMTFQEFQNTMYMLK